MLLSCLKWDVSPNNSGEHGGTALHNVAAKISDLYAGKLQSTRTSFMALGPTLSVATCIIIKILYPADQIGCIQTGMATNHANPQTPPRHCFGQC